MTCSNKIDFTADNSIAKLLDFKNSIYDSDKVHESEELMNILKVNCIKVDCKLITSSLYNGTPSQTIHEFFPSIPAGYKIVELPRHLVFHSTISKVQISLNEKEDNLINVREETITVRLLIPNGA
ncbi:Hypothetical protein CINCED_3A014545 [Cinara cedri]|uniref:Uncharacterized protein n=1 Tax=Cinara cedri TaxID=506608 RepID=A0A5E4N1W4_9HEMI|nr:Hypothetical protein CINCED_3A014545 [Cinara cedri]